MIGTGNKKQEIRSSSLSNYKATLKINPISSKLHHKISAQKSPAKNEVTARVL